MNAKIITICCILVLGTIMMPAGLLSTIDLGSGGRGTRADKDLGVEDITVLAPATGASSHYPGQTVTVNATITNFASQKVLKPFDVTFAVNDGFGNSTIQTVTIIKTLGEHMNGIYFVILQFLFTPPLIPPPQYQYPHSFMIVVTVSQNDDQVQSNNQKTKTLPVMNADFEPRMEIGEYEAGVLDPLGYDPVKARVGETLTVPFTLYNDGSGQDRIQIESVSQPLNWTVKGFSPMDLDDGENTTDDLRLIVKVSPYKQDAMQGADYVIRLRAYSLNYAPAEAFLDIHFSILFAGGVLIKTSAGELWKDPGTVVPVEFELVNKGNGVDSFHCVLEPLRKISKKNGFTAYIKQGSISLSLARDQSHTVIVDVRVPDGAKRGSICMITLVASSNKAASTKDPEDDRETVYVYANKHYDPVLEAHFPSYDVQPGVEEVIHFNVTNYGNAFDDTLELRIGARPTSWVLGLICTEISSRGLGPYTTAEIGLKLILPKETPAKDGYIISIEAWAGEPLEKRDTLELVINVREVYGVEMWSEKTLKSGYVGGLVKFDFRLKNLGNTFDTFLLDAGMLEQKHDWEVTLSQDLLNLSANMSVMLSVFVKIPIDVSADSDLNSPSVADGYRVLISVFSQSAHSASLRKLTFITKVNPVYSFTLETDQNGVVISGDRTGVVPFELKVGNTGNIKDIVDFTIESDYKWCTLITIHKYIPFREGKTVVVQASPPAGTPPGEYVFTVVGTSRGDHTYTQQVSVTVEVVSFNFRIENPRIYNQSVSNLITQGAYGPEHGYTISIRDTILIIADVVNTCANPYFAGPYGQVVVTFYDGHVPIVTQRVNFSYLVPGEAKRVSLLWNTSVAEPHELRIVVDGNDNIPEGDETDNEMKIRVNVISDIGDDDDDDDNDVEDAIFMWIIPFGLIIAIVVLVIFTVYLYRSIRIEHVDTGYDEDGEYNPMSDQYDAFEGDEVEVIEEEEIEIDMGDAYLPYKVEGQVDAPYLLPPASPYSTAAQEMEPQLALPPAPVVEQRPMLMTTKPVEAILVATKPVRTRSAVVSTKPVAAKPVTTKPVSPKTVTTKPASSKPMTTKPSLRSLVKTTKPVSSKPVMTKPVVSPA